MTKDIILFDTDGNLTESKQKFNSINYGLGLKFE